MADGFIIGTAVDTATPPTGYWTGASFAAEIDTAQFFPTLTAARRQAGELQSINVNEHVEAYSASLNVTHNPALGTGGV